MVYPVLEFGGGREVEERFAKLIQLLGRKLVEPSLQRFFDRAETPPNQSGDELFFAFLSALLNTFL